MSGLITYFYVRCDEYADRGFNRAIEVYRVRNNLPVKVASNYRLSSGNWSGESTEARKLVSKFHKFKDGKDAYSINPWKNKKVRLYQLGCNYEV